MNKVLTKHSSIDLEAEFESLTCVERSERF